jgi:hypothetical protein
MSLPIAILAISLWQRIQAWVFVQDMWLSDRILFGDLWKEVVTKTCFERLMTQWCYHVRKNRMNYFQQEFQWINIQGCSYLQSSCGGKWPT